MFETVPSEISAFKASFIPRSNLDGVVQVVS